MNIIAVLISLLFASVLCQSLQSEEICTKKLERIIHCYENNAYTFMRRMHLALLDEGTTSDLIKRFSQKYGVIVKVSDAFGYMTSITVPSGMQKYVTPLITNPAKDVTAMRAYALGTAFADDAGLLMYSATLINASTAKMTLITIYAQKTKYNQYELNIFGLNFEN